MKYFIYARKSTDDEERQILSIQAQLDELRMLAEKEGLQVVREYVEAQTAKEPGRPVFNEMLEAMERGEAQGILAWHPDRLARNSVDGGRVVYALDTGQVATLKFPTFWFENTPQGKFMLNIAFGQSKYYVDNLSENIRRGLRKKLREGIYPNMPPPGYRNDKQTRAIVIDEERALFIRKMFDAYATGTYTYASLAKTVTGWGFRGVRNKPMAASKVRDILTNPFYIGLFRFSGEIYEGKHPPLIPRELFERVQKVLKRTGRGRYVKHSRFPFRGLIICHECGCAITSDIQAGHPYYRCGKRRGPCSLKTIREEALTQLLRASIRRVSISDEAAALMLAEVERWVEADAQAQAVRVERQKSDLARISARLDRLLAAFIDGDIERGDFTAMKEKLTFEKAALADSIAKFEDKGVGRFKTLVDFITASRQAKYDAQTENLDELRNWHKKVGSKLIFSSRTLGSERGEAQAAPPPNGYGSQGGSEGLPPPIPMPRGGSAARSACKNHKNPSQNGSFSFVADPKAPFVPILPQDLKAVAPAEKFFRSLGSKTDPVLHIQYPPEWADVLKNPKPKDWRRERDSNPRCRLYRHDGLAIRCFQPLSHLSATDMGKVGDEGVLVKQEYWSGQFGVEAGVGGMVGCGQERQCEWIANLGLW